MASQQSSLLNWLDRELDACRDIAMRYFRKRRLQVRRKADGSPVTDADRRIEERLRQALRRACPGEPIVGEEFGGTAPRDGTFWTIDPIDGTRAFSRGLPSWGILVGRVEAGRAVVGVCDFPLADARVAVAPGVAARERFRGSSLPLPRKRMVRPLSETVLFHGGVNWWQGTPFLAGFERLMSACYLERAYGDCFGYLWVLRGYADAMLDYVVHVWDLAPLAALAESTGLALTDERGRPSFRGPGAIMAPPRLARTISRALTHSS